jgi:two-component system, NarL family, sensor histidine kinase UhpB
MPAATLSFTPRRQHAWQHPLFWKMLAADLLLVGFAVTAFPARTGERLILMIAAIALASLVVNLVLTPVALRPLHAAQDAARRLAAGLSTAGPDRPTVDDPVQRIDELLSNLATEIEQDRARSLLRIRRSLHAHEAERAAIAAELRDAAAQQLTALTLQLSVALKENHDERIVATLEMARDLAAEAATDLAALSERISPAWRGEFGLASALEALRHRVTERSALGFTLEIRGTPIPPSLPLTRALLRVAEAAVDNVARHADAASVTVELSFANSIIRLEVADDAKGFDLAVLDRADGGLGLFRARELLAHEGGEMQIESTPGCGVRVIATVDTSLGATA